MEPTEHVIVTDPARSVQAATQPLLADDIRHRLPLSVDQQCGRVGCSATACWYPCINCYGATLYCSDGCRLNDIDRHQMQCIDSRSKVIPANEHTTFQLNVQSEDTGLRAVANNISSGGAAQLRRGAYVARLGGLTTPKRRLRPKGAHAIYKDDAGLEQLAATSFCMREAAAWFRNRRATADKGYDVMHLCFYPPDMSFVCVSALSYDAIVQSEACVFFCTCPSHTGGA